MEINEELAYRISLLHLGYEIVVKDKELLVSNEKHIHSFHPHTSFKIVYNHLCGRIGLQHREDNVVQKTKPKKIKNEIETNFVPKEIQTTFNPKPDSKLKLTKTQKRREQRNRQKARLIAKGVQCHYCETILTEENFSWDHIVPKVSGGGNNKKNKIPSCKKCNNDKSDKPYEVFTQKPLPVEYIQ